MTSITLVALLFPLLFLLLLLMLLLLLLLLFLLLLLLLLLLLFCRVSLLLLFLPLFITDELSSRFDEALTVVTRFAMAGAIVVATGWTGVEAWKEKFGSYSCELHNLFFACDGVTCSCLLGTGRTKTLVSWALSCCYCQHRGRPPRYTHTCTLQYRVERI